LCWSINALNGAAVTAQTSRPGTCCARICRSLWVAYPELGASHAPARQPQRHAREPKPARWLPKSKRLRLRCASPAPDLSSARGTRALQFSRVRNVHQSTPLKERACSRVGSTPVRAGSGVEPRTSARTLPPPAPSHPCSRRLRSPLWKMAGWAAAGFVDTNLSFLSFLELYRTDVAQRRMTPPGVVEALDVIEHIRPGLLSAAVDLPGNALRFH